MNQLKILYDHIKDFHGSSIRVWIGVTSILTFFLGWEVIAHKYFSQSHSFPPPSVVIGGFSFWINSGTFISDVVVSLSRILVGFIFGALLGTISGVGAGMVKQVRWWINPIINMLRPIPPIALVTLAIIWFGIGEVSKYFIVTWAVFFQVWISTYLGVSRVDKRLIWAGLSLGAGGISLARKVILPAALPSIIIGLRTGIGIAFFSLIAAELAGSFRGLGFRIDLSTSYFRSDIMIAAIITLGVIGALTDAVFAGLINLIFPWYKGIRK